MGANPVKYRLGSTPNPRILKGVIMIGFYHDGDGIKVSLVVENHEITWMDLTEHYLDFLSACGYMLNRVEVGDYIVEQYESDREDN